MRVRWDRIEEARLQLDLVRALSSFVCPVCGGTISGPVEYSGVSLRSGKAWLSFRCVHGHTNAASKLLNQSGYNPLNSDEGDAVLSNPMLPLNLLLSDQPMIRLLSVGAD